MSFARTLILLLAVCLTAPATADTTIDEPTSGLFSVDIALTAINCPGPECVACANGEAEYRFQASNFDGSTLGITEISVQVMSGDVASAGFVNGSGAVAPGGTAISATSVDWTFDPTRLEPGDVSEDLFVCTLPSTPPLDSLVFDITSEFGFNASGTCEFGLLVGSCGDHQVFQTGLGYFAEPSFDGNIIVGTQGADNLFGSDERDLILGLGGADQISGEGGGDSICGGDGADSIEGGPGADTIRGERGRDNLHGNGGEDTIFGGRGRDDLNGGPGSDELFGEEGADLLIGLDGGDCLEGGPGRDTLLGGNGGDTLDGGTGNDKCSAGNSGADVEVNCER